MNEFILSNFETISAPNKPTLPSSITTLPDVWWCCDDPLTAWQLRDGYSAYRVIPNKGLTGSFSAQTAIATSPYPIAQTTSSQAPTVGYFNNRKCCYSYLGSNFGGPGNTTGLFDNWNDPGTNCTLVAMFYFNSIPTSAGFRHINLTKTSTVATSKGIMFYVDNLANLNKYKLLVSDGTNNTLNLASPLAATTGYSRTAIRKQSLNFDAKINNSSIFSGTASNMIAGNGSNATLIMGSSGATNSMDGYFGEMMIWNSTALNDTQLTDLNNYLIQRWGS